MSQATPSLTLSARRRYVFSALAFGFVLTLLTPAMAVAQAGELSAETAVTWSVRPANNEQGRDRPNFGYAVAPGAQLSDALTVTNRSPEPLTLDVYAADGFLTPDGTLDVLAGGEPSAELGSWVGVEVPQVTLASGETAEIPFSIAVPAAAAPGDYAAGVVASMRVQADDGTITERRLGSRIHLRVLGDLAPALAVADVVVDYHGTVNPVQNGSATVRFTLVNTGNTRLDPDAAVSVAGPFGWAAVSATDNVPEMLPGSSIERTVEVAGVAPLAMLTADVASTATVVSPGATPSDALPQPILAEGAATTAAVPWSALVLLLVVAALVAWRVDSRRRAKAKQQQRIDDAVAAARGEAAAERRDDDETSATANRSVTASR